MGARCAAVGTAGVNDAFRNNKIIKEGKRRLKDIRVFEFIITLPALINRAITELFLEFRQMNSLNFKISI